MEPNNDYDPVDFKNCCNDCPYNWNDDWDDQ